MVGSMVGEASNVGNDVGVEGWKVDGSRLGDCVGGEDGSPVGDREGCDGCTVGVIGLLEGF